MLRTELNLFELFLQDCDVNLAFYLQSVYISHYPTTLIDLSSREVRLSSLPHKHWLKQQEALKNEIVALWTGTEAGYPTG